MKKLTYLYIAPLFVLFGCNKMLDTKTPANTLYPSAVYTDSANVKAAVLAIYSGVVNSNTYGSGLSQWDALYADEVTSASTNFPTFLTNSLSATDDNVGYIWLESYSGIYRTNSVIEGVSASTALTATARQQALGEAYFWRAFLHFSLLNVYGSIPLITSTNTSDIATAPQATADAVYKQIISDLTQSINDLPATYTVSGTERTRVNKLAAIALLAKVYLYQGDWVNAETQASLIISNSLFTLPSDLTTVFLNTSTEAILQLDNKPSGYVGWASAFVPASGVVPTYIMLDNLLNAFETGDKRKTNWTGVSAGYTYPAKYKVRTTGSSEYLTLLRLAEIYLIRAEARAEQSKLTDAASDLNAVRQRAGLTVTTAADQASLLLAVEQERRVELFCESGTRFFDLKRTGRADAVLGAEKTSWKSTAVNYPIPSVEISKNVNLKQNAGYN